MIANFFRSLNQHRVEYLLISGQATVLYGAATFSEDIDLWIHPTEDNCPRFLAALRDCGVRYYKLTPPLTVEHLARGHGFHFVLPGRGEPDAFLDVMGAPPRVGSFAAALAQARSMDSEWGRLPTIGLRSLVELKKTQRLEDYSVISKLAVAWFDQPDCAKAAEDFVWAAVPFVPIGVHSWLKSQGEGKRPFDSDRVSPIHGTPSLLSGRSAHEILRFVRASAAFILRDLRKGK